MQIFSAGRTNQPKVVQEVLADLKKKTCLSLHALPDFFMHLLILRCRFARNKILLTNQSEWAFGHLKKRSRREKDFPWLLQRLFFKLSYSAMADLRICLFITLQLQVLLSVAIYNSHVQWKIKSITFAVSALLRNSEARLLIGFVWIQYRQFYYTRREQFYLCLKRNADEL